MSRQQLPPQIKKLSVLDRGTGKQVVRYQLIADAGRNPQTGKRQQVRRRFATEREARKALADITGDVESDNFVARNDVTVEQVCVEWIESLHWARKTTIAGYEYNLAPWREQHGPLLVQKFNRRQLDELVRKLKKGGTTTAKGKVRRPWANRSLKRTVETISMVLDYAKERKLVSHNVAKAVKPKKGKTSKPKPFTPEEVVRVLGGLDGDRDEHAWHLALRGLRRSEVGGLRWPGVDFENKTLDVEIGRASAGGKAVEDDPKTDASIRTLPLDNEMVEVLRRAHRRQAADKLQLGDAYDDKGYVVCNEDGTPYHPDTLTHRWATMLKRVGVRHIRLHDARHTCGTIMHLRKVPLAVIAAWLGHADASVTARIYTHSQDEAMADAAKVYGGVVTTSDTQAG
ncbi:tyrosine-type recombinase/integrase [Nocardia arthritidis]|uniref:Tyrosine-type recombinase/integrase n=1 Tax=Nocardia arthritidis TaxID=228602 RepID=A0A6G9Y8C2_9NOCA|nr:tyrosine-type recombinase/integrase [Nocardia arthritidis]QIS09394.1 tyrosine-type recombinase/integrase [Nocardia arthritidis]